MKSELAEKVLPYWYDTAQDREHGGYRLADDAVRGRLAAREKQLVTQSRMIWGFAHAHRKGFSTDQRSYLDAAEQGHRFLRDHFLDRRRGGYFWKTEPSGRLISDVKNLYAEVFVIHALVELHRASRRPEPLQEAMDLYQTLQRHAHDARHGGWLEHFTRRWRLITKRTPGADIEVPGLKSANAHLHLMEAYTELYDATRDEGVKRSLAEAVEINTRHFFPEQAGRSVLHRHPDWRPVTDPKSADSVRAPGRVRLAADPRPAGSPRVQPAWGHFCRPRIRPGARLRLRPRRHVLLRDRRPTGHADR
jgi:mannobiose 2-epimerase